METGQRLTEQPREQKTSRYVKKSLVYSDDSVRFEDAETGKTVWGLREYRDGKRTGNFELEDGTVVKGVQIPVVETPKTREFVIGGYRRRDSFYFSDDSLFTSLKELSYNGYSIRHIHLVYQPSDAYSKEHSEESDSFIFSGAEDGSLFGIKLFQDKHYLIDLTVEGGKNKDADGYKTKFYHDNFSLELKNKICGEWSLTPTGVYRDDGYETSWIEVHVGIEGEKEETVKKLEDIVKKAVVESKFTHKCVGEV